MGIDKEKELKNTVKEVKRQFDNTTRAAHTRFRETRFLWDKKDATPEGSKKVDELQTLADIEKELDRLKNTAPIRPPEHLSYERWKELEKLGPDRIKKYAKHYKDHTMDKLKLKLDKLEKSVTYKQYEGWSNKERKKHDKKILRYEAAIHIKKIQLENSVLKKQISDMEHNINRVQSLKGKLNIFKDKTIEIDEKQKWSIICGYKWFGKSLTSDELMQKTEELEKYFEAKIARRKERIAKINKLLYEDASDGEKQEQSKLNEAKLEDVGEELEMMEKLKNIKTLKYNIAIIKQRVDNSLSKYEKDKALIEDSTLYKMFIEHFVECEKKLPALEQYIEGTQIDSDKFPKYLEEMENSIKKPEKFKIILKNIIELKETVKNFRESEKTSQDVVDIVNRLVPFFRRNSESLIEGQPNVSLIADLPVEYLKAFAEAKGIRVQKKSTEEPCRDTSEEFKEYANANVTTLEYLGDGSFSIQTNYPEKGTYYIAMDVEQKILTCSGIHRYKGLHFDELLSEYEQLLQSELKNGPVLMSKEDWDKAKNDNIDIDNVEYKQVRFEEVNNGDVIHTSGFYLPDDDDDEAADGNLTAPKGSESYDAMLGTELCSGVVRYIAQRRPGWEITQFKTEETPLLNVIVDFGKK